jgi:Na+/melibiose symporter-like transporter
MLDELLTKSESYRRRVAFVVTALIGIVIFIIWLIITRYNVKKVFKDKEPQKTATEQFRESLPSINNKQTIPSELEKDMETKNN